MCDNAVEPPTPLRADMVWFLRHTNTHQNVRMCECDTRERARQERASAGVQNARREGHIYIYNVYIYICIENCKRARPAR